LTCLTLVIQNVINLQNETKLQKPGETRRKP